MIEDIITQKMPKYKIQARFLRIYPYISIGIFCVFVTNSSYMP